MSEDVANAPSTIDDLRTAMKVTGTVKRIELYGAFVDIGIGQDALLHVSQLGKKNVRNVEDVVKVQDKITAYILKVDKDAGRIALSMEKPPALSWDDIRPGETYKGEVVRIENFGVFVDLGAERPGMVHVSELTEGFVQNPSDVVSIGQEVEARVININKRKKQIDLSMKQPSYTAVVEDEDEEEMPTAMALAFRRAMEEEGVEMESNRRQSGKRNKKHNRSREQEDIIERTLRHHNSN